MRIVMNRRARLGIKVNLQARDTDSLGAYVESVTPNGPAAKAGLRSGDVITKLDGKSVLSGGGAGDRDDRGSRCRGSGSSSSPPGSSRPTRCRSSSCAARTGRRSRS